MLDMKDSILDRVNQLIENNRLEEEFSDELSKPGDEIDYETLHILNSEILSFEDQQSILNGIKTDYIAYIIDSLNKEVEAINNIIKFYKFYSEVLRIKEKIKESNLLINELEEQLKNNEIMFSLYVSKYKDYKKNNPDSDLLYENLIIDLDSEVEFRLSKILSSVSPKRRRAFYFD